MPYSGIRKGKISAVNYDAGMARVTYRDKDDSVTAEFAFVTNNDEYRMPEVGQDVLVAHLSNGSSRGVIIGTIWNKKYKPRETGEGLYRKDFSRVEDAAYARYSDEEGEYLLKVPRLRLNGVHETVLDGPALEIAANLYILIQSERLKLDTEKVLVTGGETGCINMEVKADVRVRQEGKQLEADMLKAEIGTEKTVGIMAGTGLKLEAGECMEVSAAEKLALSGDGGVEISSGSGLRLSDGKYDTTLAEIMERLENLGG